MLVGETVCLPSSAADVENTLIREKEPNALNQFSVLFRAQSMLVSLGFSTTMPRFPYPSVEREPVR